MNDATLHIKNAITIDVEDYFQVSAFAPHIRRDEWETYECRVEHNIGRILGMLDDHGVKGTFFTLGWIAKRYPGVVREIVSNGHELASHGFGHQRASDLTEAEFFDDISSAKQLLEDQAGSEVRGYRAPSFSIDESNLAWAFDCLHRAGYRYSSSVYPIAHDHYGMPAAPRFAYTSHADLIEVPPTTVRAMNRNWPASGGGYFRLMPYLISQRLIKYVNSTEGQAVVFYFHPWEIDARQPRIPGIGMKTRFRHYLNLHRTEARLRRLLSDFHWGRMDEIFLGS